MKLIAAGGQVTAEPRELAQDVVRRIAGGLSGPGVGTDKPDQPVTITPAMTAQTTVQGGTASPVSPDTENVTQNNVAGQIYGKGSPANVYI